jgi:hypothetical protein
LKRHKQENSNNKCDTLVHLQSDTLFLLLQVIANSVRFYTHASVSRTSSYVRGIESHPAGLPRQSSV